MGWYQCENPACNATFDLGKVLLQNKPDQWCYCVACGGKAKSVHDMEDRFWLTMSSRYALSVPLLKELMEQFKLQQQQPRFDFWLTALLKEAEEEEENGD